MIEPLIIEQQDITDALAGDRRMGTIPIIGDQVPEKWRRVDVTAWGGHGIFSSDNNGYSTFFVDASGFGKKSESALTLGEFLHMIRPGFGYAIIERGQFQVKIGVFKKILKQA